MDDVRTGYVLESGARATHLSRIIRGFRRSDGLRVVVKAPSAEYPSAAELAQIRHEYALLRDLEGAPTVRALELVRVDHGLGLVLEDLGTRSLDRLIQAGGLDLTRFLKLARLAAAALEAVHARGVLHKDIKPQHFFADEGERRLLLLDFSIATAVRQEEQRPIGLDALEGTLPYISPEQTGRMNRSVDRRSDLYSLGVTLYELLTGALPFETSDALELVHSHIARLARPPVQRMSVPRVVSDIVMRLLEKAAEDRYQTAAGLEADLAQCEQQLASSGQIQPFSLAQRDRSSELRIPQKLYGREADALRLRESLERAKLGAAELVLISGGAGIGKSALVQELQKDLGLTGNFSAGKFDQYSRGVPYSAIAAAARELVRAELASSAEQLGNWRAQVLSAVGHNGSLLLDIVPELKLVIGEQPATAPLAPLEAQNRFEGVFQRFMQVSASAEQPLIVFLDDLQWADAASMRLIRLMVHNPEQKYLLVIGSYREGELNAAPALRDLLDEAAGDRVHVRLGPLGREHVEALLCDTFGQRSEEMGAFAELVTRKTGGNPFFISQFLDSLHRQGLLALDSERKVWTWRLDAIEAAGVTSNVVELVLAKLQRLEPETGEALALAACVGHSFDLQGLAAIAQRGAVAVAESLWQAVKEGFVVPLDKNYRLVSRRADGAAAELNAAYRFTHDRVQQAAYALIPEAERGPIHLSIGRRLLAASGPGGPSDEAIFDVVGALNLGRAHIREPSERRQLATLDVRAARRARRASAPGTAQELCDIALELLGDEPWQTDYDVAQAAHVIRAESSYLVGNCAAALASTEQLKQRGRTLLERVEAGNLHAHVLTHQGRLEEASTVTLEVLRWLGVSLPDANDKAALGQAIGREFAAFQAALAGRSVESLAALPEMTDPDKLALVSSFFTGIPAAFQSNPELMLVMVLVAARLPLEHGNAPQSTFFYEQYAIAHLLITSDFETAYRFGQLGMKLSDHPQRQRYLTAVCFLFGGFVAHWRRPLAECLEYFRRGTLATSESGDEMYGAYCISIACCVRLFAGDALERLQADVAGYIHAQSLGNDVINLAYLSIIDRVVRCLRGQAASLGAFDDEAEFEVNAPPPIRGIYGGLKAMLRYLAGDARQALQATEQYQPLPALFYNAEYALYRSLALAELARQAEGEARAALLERLAGEIATHARWAEACPENFAHRYDLLCAERDAILDRVESAMTLYDRAIGEATAQSYTHLVALASELCGRFHHRAGRVKVARSYLIEARYHYERWGALAKAEQLVGQFPELEPLPVARDPGASTRSAQTHTQTGVGSTRGDGGLDLISAMRAAQAIAGELDLERLVERLLRILLENAGAQRGALILHEAGQLSVVAALNVDPDRVELGLSEPLASSARVSASVVQFVARMKEPVVLDDASKAQRFVRDEYLQSHGTRSLACMPLLHQGELSAILYLENAAVAGAFTAGRVQRLQFLGSQAAVAIENAKLYGQVQAATRRLEEANDSLEQKVRARTRELQGRNEDMRRVLDNVAQALISIDLSGRMASERSAVVERWFGELADGATFADAMQSVDPAFASWFAVSLSMVVDDVLPTEVALEQMPRRLVHGAREYRVSYSAIRSGQLLTGVLIVIDDVTDAIQLARAEADQKEQLALFQGLARDRAAVAGFFEEGAELVAKLRAPAADAAGSKRALHTLKGNASMHGLALLAARCHAAEDALAEGASLADALGPVLERWAQLLGTRDLLVGDRAQDVLEIERSAFEALLQRAHAGASARDIAWELERWTLESLHRPLQRLGEHAKGLAERLGKAQADVVICDAGVLADPFHTRTLWSVLVHVLRNAVDHGFETELERLQRGKPERNQLQLGARLEQGAVVLEIADDGHGIDWERVRELAEERQIPCASREELLAVLLTPSVSTRSEISATSGRGEGLAAVQRDVEALGGQLSVESETGCGCAWTIRIPAAALGARAAQPPELSPGYRSGSHRVASLPSAQPSK